MGPKNEQIVEATGKDILEQATPKCPYCCENKLRLAMGAMEFQTGHIVQIVYCGNPECGKLLPFQIVGMRQPQIVQAEKKILMT